MYLTATALKTAMKSVYCNLISECQIPVHAVAGDAMTADADDAKPRSLHAFVPKSLPLT